MFGKDWYPFISKRTSSTLRFGKLSLLINSELVAINVIVTLK